MSDEELSVKAYICSNCGEMTDFPMTVSKGGGSCAIILCLLIVGLIFSLLINPLIGIITFIIAIFIPFMIPKNDVGNVCPFCETENSLLPTGSPRGNKLLHEFYEDVEE